LIQQTKLYPWGCPLASFAMALDVDQASLVDEIGHDGSEIVFDWLDEPMCRRGFHLQELIDVAWRRGYATTQVELLPAVAPTRQRAGGSKFVIVRYDEGNFDRFDRLVRTNRGVLSGEGRRCLHAVAFDHGTVFDPDPGSVPYSYSLGVCEEHRFFPNLALILTSVTANG
jgi:hypothetical protein